MEEQNGLRLEKEEEQVQADPTTEIQASAGVNLVKTGTSEPAETMEPDETDESDAALMDEIERAKHPLVYRISPDDLYHFHLWMSADGVKKNKKRMMAMGAIELIFGGAYMVSLLISGGEQPPMQYLLALLLAGMGAYGLTFHKFGFEKSLRKSVKRQHDKTPYFQQDILLDLYPNKCVEHIGGESQPSYWKDIKSVRVDARAFIIMLETKRCVLIPKQALAEDERNWVDAFLTDMCERFEKPREEV